MPEFWIALIVIAIAMTMIGIWVSRRRPEDRLEEHPSPPPPQQRPTGDYRSWGVEEWQAWELAEAAAAPLPADNTLWTKDDWKRWEQSEWLRLWKEDETSTEEPTEIAANRLKPKAGGGKRKPQAKTVRPKNSPTKNFTPDQLTPVCRELFQKVSQGLPSEISRRLSCNDHVRNHNNYRTFYMFSIWDVNQCDILNREHCCYGLRYDPLMIRGDPTPWHFLLWINTVRIYQNQKEIKTVVETALEKACPRPFKFIQTERGVQLKWNFEWDRPLAELTPHLTPNVVKLIRNIHPILMPIFDSFTQPLSKEERREIIAGRKKQYFGPDHRPDPETIREYTRSIPPSWRSKILARTKHKCVHCGASLKGKSVHIDHIMPFSKGGKTTLENLQALCGPCNLAKGNRLDY